MLSCHVGVFVCAVVLCQCFSVYAVVSRQSVFQCVLSCHVSVSVCAIVLWAVFHCAPSCPASYIRVSACAVVSRVSTRTESMCAGVTPVFFFECVQSCRVSVFYRVMISVSVSAIVLRQRFGVCAAVVSYQCFSRVMTVSVTPTRNVCRRVVSVTLYRGSHQCFGVCSCVMSGVCHRLSSS